jgi:hypothetical protein
MEQTAAPLERGTDLAAVQRILAARAHSVAQHVDKAIYTLDMQLVLHVREPRRGAAPGAALGGIGRPVHLGRVPTRRLRARVRVAPGGPHAGASAFEMFHPSTGESFQIHAFADELGVTVCLRAQSR